MSLCIVVQDDPVGSLLTSLLPGGAAGAGGWKTSECLGSHTARRLVSAATETSFICFSWCCLWRATVQTLWDVVFLVSCWLAGLLSARSAVALDGDRAVCCLRRAVFHFCHAISTLPVDLLMFIQVLGEVFDWSEKSVEQQNPQESSVIQQPSPELGTRKTKQPFGFHSYWISISIPRSRYGGWHSFSHILRSQLSKYHHSSC